MTYDHTQEQLDGLEELKRELERPCLDDLKEGHLTSITDATFVSTPPDAREIIRVGRGTNGRIRTQMLAYSTGLLATVPHFDRPNEMVLPSPEYLEIQRKYARSAEAAQQAAEAKRQRRLERNRQNRPN